MSYRALDGGLAIVDSANRESVKGRPHSVAVVGAGAAGLSAAWQLLSSGHEVTVFERREDAGGRMRSDQLNGIGFDAATQLVASNYSEFFALADQLGAANQLVRSPGRDALWRKGRAHNLRYGSLGSMVTSTALPTVLKLKLATQYLPFLKRHAQLDLHDMNELDSLDLDVASIGEWGTRELSDDFVDLLVYPMLGAYYGATPEQVSAPFYHALARAGLDIAVYAARGGMGTLAGALANSLAERGAILRFQTPIERIESVSNGVAVVRAAGAERYDAAIIAVPAPEAARLLAASPVADWLTRVQAVPTCTLALALSRPTPVDYFGLSLARGESDSVVAVCVQENKSGNLVPEGRGALVVMPAPASAPALARLTPAEVLERLLPAVERMLPGTGASVERARVTFFPEGNPLFYPGYFKHLAAFPRDCLPNRIQLAGDYLVAPTVEGAVRSGVKASAGLLRQLHSE